MRLTRDLDLPRVIVWDALVDQDLVSGWLGEAAIVPVVGGEYNLTRVHLPDTPTTFGRITVLQPLERLHIDTTDVGLLEFALEERAGGSRSTSTRLTLTVTIDLDPSALPRVRADWLVCLDQLDELLRGHPVDWANWNRDHHDTWTRYLERLPDSAS